MAESDAKVVFQLELDDSKLRSDLNKTVRDLERQGNGNKNNGPTITVNADTSAATTALHKVKADAEGVENSDPTVTVEADASAATTELDGVKDKAEEVENSDPTVTVEADASAATTELDDVKDRAEAVEGSDPTVTVDADTAAAITELDNVGSTADEIENSDPTVTVEADTTTAVMDLNRVKTKSDAVENSDPTVTVAADAAAATTTLSEAKSQADAVENSDPTVTVDADAASAKTTLGEAKSQADEVENSDPTVTVGADADDAKSDLDDILDTADKISNHSLFKNGIKLGAGMKIGSSLISAATGAVRSGVGTMFSAGQSYEKGLAKASTLAPVYADMDAFGARLLQLSSETGQSIETLTEAAYNSLSASQSFGDATGSDLIEYLRLSSKLAIGGFSDTNTAALAMAKTLNAYGMDSTQGDRIANVMLRTQNRGITDVDKLSASLANVTAVAASAGVSIEEVGAMISTVTAQGKETAEATTMSRTLLTELLKDDTEANKSMKAALRGTGYSGMGLSEIMAAGGNMVDVLSAMQSYADKQGVSLLKLFSSTEAGMGAQFLLTGGGATYLDNLAYMNGSEDSVGAAYETMTQTTSTSLEKIKAQFQGYAAQLYAALAPSMQKLLDLVSGDKFQTMAIRLINKITALLEGDFFEKATDALVTAADTLMGLLNGDIKLGDLFSGFWDWASNGIESGLKPAINYLLTGLVDIVNSLIEVLGVSWIFKGVDKIGLPYGIEPDGVIGGDENARHGAGRSDLLGTGDEKTVPQDQRWQELLNKYAVRDSASLYSYTGRQIFDDLLEAAVGLGYEWAIPIQAAIEDAAKGYTEVTESKSGDNDTKNGNTNVADLQTALTNLGFSPGKIDGIYGNQTQSAVKEFQTGNGLEATGQVDAATAAAMNAALQEAAGGAQAASDSSTELAASETAAAAAADSAATGTISFSGIIDQAKTKTSGFLTSTQTALSAFSTKLANLTPNVNMNVDVVVTVGGGTTAKVAMRHAVGLDSVPYDNYPALLHRGETVLNAAEASAYRMYQNGARFGGGIDYDALAHAMGNLSLDIDGHKMGHLTERGVSDAQGRRFSRMTRRG